MRWARQPTTTGWRATCQPGDRISLADGAVELRVNSTGDDVACAKS